MPSVTTSPAFSQTWAGFMPMATPAGVQFLIALDTNLKPVPTSLVESVRVTVFKSVDGEPDLSTNTEKGINVAKYTIKRRLAFRAA